MLKKVTVVDDSQDTLNILEAVLRKAGYRVQVIQNGAEAFAKIKEAPPDLILLDIMMPEVDGFEVCRRVKADAGLRRIPIFMISAKDDPLDREQSFRLGVDAFITKPVYPREIVRKIKTLFTESDRRSRGERTLFGRLYRLTG